MNMQNVNPFSLFSEQDIYLFREGKHYRLYDKFGSHSAEDDGRTGTYFAVWAPHAREVSVIGNFNGWNSEQHKLFPRWDGSGIWEGFIAGLTWGTLYKYGIRTNQGVLLEKSDPYALSFEQNVQAASLVSTTWYEWRDGEWMKNRHKKNSLKAPPFANTMLYDGIILHSEFHLQNQSICNLGYFCQYNNLVEVLFRQLPYQEFSNFWKVNNLT